MLRTIDRRSLAAASLAAICAIVLYADVLRRLVLDWWTDENYSHGFLIVPIALYLVFERRARLERAPQCPTTVVGLAVIAFSLLLLAAGTLGSEFFLTRVSLIGTIAGSVLFLFGPSQLRILVFPLAFLLLMIPIPAIVFNQVAFPLQLLASRVGETLVWLAGVPVLREGNVIVLASSTLEVAEACSGIRSLVSLLTLGILFGYFSESRNPVRVLLALATVPLAIVANGLRVAGTGIAAHSFGQAAAEGFFHTFSGWLVFLTSVVMLLAVGKLIRVLWPLRPITIEAPAAVELI